ncbi:MAG TPA: hypothetical protein VG986_03410 [Pseudolabrys sp.]|nr:hypothetical protein [Pseudolabrys sp.]
MAKVTLEQAASQYAWTLGHDDYPAADRCPYHPVKSRALHNAYWNGWFAAATFSEREAKLARTAA